MYYMENKSLPVALSMGRTCINNARRCQFRSPKIIHSTVGRYPGDLYRY